MFTILTSQHFLILSGQSCIYVQMCVSVRKRPLAADNSKYINLGSLEIATHSFQYWSH